MSSASHYILLLFLIFGARSHAEKTQQPAPLKLPKTIYATLPAVGDVFWRTVQKGIEAGAADNGYQLLIRSAQQDRQYSEDKYTELSLVNFLIKNGARSVILAPSPALDKTLEIPKAEYIFAGRGSNDSTLPYKGRVLVAIDDYDAGKKAALLLKNKLSKGSKVGVFYVYLTEERMKGFLAKAKELGYNVVFNVLLEPGIRENQGTVKNYLEKNPDVKAVFTTNELSTFTTLMETKKLLKEKRPLHVGFDFRTEFMEPLRNGNLFSLIVQDPYLIGYKCAEVAVELEKGRQVPQRVKIDTFVIDQKNVDSAEIKNRLKYYFE